MASNKVLAGVLALVVVGWVSHLLPDDPAKDSEATKPAAGEKHGAHRASAPRDRRRDAGAATKAEHVSKPKPRPVVRTYDVTRIVDGDTLELGTGQTVRLVGIDTPEVGECGYQVASDNLARLVLDKRVRLTVSDEDTDRYGRLLRYVDVGTVDAGLRLIKNGVAIARYDSRDGYGYHPRQPAYIAADKGARNLTCAEPAPKPQPLMGGGGSSCMAGYSPCLPVVADLDCADVNGTVRVTGSDPYRLDADGDGYGCDS